MRARKARESGSAARPTDSSKPQLQQSTAILQSHSTTLNFPSKNHLQSQSHSKFYHCCNTAHNQDLHFRPEVHTLPFQIYPYNSHALARSKKEQWETLTQNNRVKTQQRTEAKLREEENRLKQCTFMPEVSQFALACRQQPVHNKLYEEAEKRRRQHLEQEKQRIERERKEIESYHNARPDVEKWKILNKEKFDLEPLYKRLQKVIEEKKRSRKMVAEKEETSYSFQPQVSDASKKLVKKRMVENVVDRLIEDYKRKEERMGALKQNIEVNLKKELTFTPAINNYITDSHVRINRTSCNYQQDYSFVPSINPISSIMMQDRQNETSEEKMYRLCSASLLKKKDKIARIEAQAYADCHFNPEINEISRQMNVYGHKHHLCEVKQPEGPTHQPQINETSRNMSNSKRAKSLDNIRKKKQEKEASYKQETEYLKMKECSFKPKIKDNKSERKIISSQVSIQEVAGFKHFYENIEKAQQKERERREIEERLFHLQRNYDLRMQRLDMNKAAVQL